MSWLREVDQWLCDEILPHQGAFITLSRRITGNGDIARDLVQDVYAELLAGEKWREARDAKAFVMRIVYCRSVNWVNRQTIVPLRSLPTLEMLMAGEDGPDAFEILAGREELAAVLEALNDLPKRCRQVVTMRRLDELSPPEIARRLGVSIGAVDKYLMRGLAMLYDRLGDQVSGSRRPKAAKVKNASQAE